MQVCTSCPWCRIWISLCSLWTFTIHKFVEKWSSFGNVVLPKAQLFQNACHCQLPWPRFAVALRWAHKTQHTSWSAFGEKVSRRFPPRFTYANASHPTLHLHPRGRYCCLSLFWIAIATTVVVSKWLVDPCVYSLPVSAPVTKFES